MSLSYTPDPDEQERSKRLTEIASWARGGKINHYAEDQDSLTFDAVAEDAAQEAADVAENNSQNARARAHAMYKLALARDMRYAAMGRRRMFELGVHNALREVYEGIKIDIDVQQA